MQKKKAPQQQVIFANLKDDQEPTQVQSLCVNCEKNGITTILMTKIPFFREVIITSFLCEDCGFRNNQIQFAGKLPDYGVSILFRVMSKADLNRDVIRSQHAKIYFEEIDFEIPMSGKDQITTIQGLLRRAFDELKFHQPLRKVHEPQRYEQLQAFLGRVEEYMQGNKFPLTVKITDPSGNSHIKNPFAPQNDKNMEITYNKRTFQELIAMGYNKENAQQQINYIQDKNLGNKINFSKPFEQNGFMNQEPVIFDVPCHSCHMMGQMKMCQISVPYFTDIVIMSFKCDYCGAHTTQTKNSGEIKQNACVITLNAEGDDDLKRDLFKSQTCAVNIPQIDLELMHGTLGGVFTTVEGLLEKIHDHLQENNPFGDSDPEFAGKMAAIIQDLDDMREGKRPFKLILSDPLASSFILNPYHPSQDKRCKIEFRPRTFEENQELGINDMKVENYGQSKQTQNKQNE